MLLEGEGSGADAKPCCGMASVGWVLFGELIELTLEVDWKAEDVVEFGALWVLICGYDGL